MRARGSFLITDARCRVPIRVARHLVVEAIASEAFGDMLRVQVEFECLSQGGALEFIVFP